MLQLSSLAFADHGPIPARYTADGELHQAEVLIYATGFESTHFLAPLEVTGRAVKEYAG